MILKGLRWMPGHSKKDVELLTIREREAKKP